MKQKNEIETQYEELSNIRKAAMLANDYDVAMMCLGARMALDWTIGEEKEFPITADMIKEKQSFDF